MRIALYSHDALGLGHVRRNLAIAGALSGRGATTLLVTGVREANAFPAPDGVDYLTLPGYAKDAAGTYRARSLNLSTERLAALRAHTMAGALSAFEPDVLIVDKHPLGLQGELLPALEQLRALGTRCVLGLRDVLDQPDRVRREWRAARCTQAVREHYHDVWIYGDRRVYDLVHECGLERAIGNCTSYTGYLGRGVPVPRACVDAPTRPRLALCMVGGGEDGFALADAFARAPMPPRTDAIVVAGPLMAAAQRRALHRHAGPRMQVVDFLPRPDEIIDEADVVVTMGGYNTVCELLAREKRTLVVPRVAPRMEQLIRSLCLRRQGLVDVLHPRAATPEAVGAWLALTPRPRGRAPIDLGGLQRIPQLLDLARTEKPVRASAG